MKNGTVRANRRSTCMPEDFVKDK